jgi:hypothetical protein
MPSNEFSNKKDDANNGNISLKGNLEVSDLDIFRFWLKFRRRPPPKRKFKY